MKLKRRILALTAGAALLGGIAVAATPVSGWAATPSCGHSCPDIYPQEYAAASIGGAPQFVVDSYQQGHKVGTPVILFRASNADPAEDFTYSDQGTVSDFYAAGLVSPEVALHYGCVSGTVNVAGAQIACPVASDGVDDIAYEIQYAPFGVDSGLCMGVASVAVSGEKVSLQPCGISSRTVWVQDTFGNDDSPSTDGFWAAINGSDTDFSNPFVLTYPSDAYPTDYLSGNPHRPQLEVANLAQFSQGTVPDDDNQLFTAFAGELP
jgi:hypothetical protein